jgi:glycosyltransferase involved in cell wall biosynthesis
MIEISVNLATHNRASCLEACLVSLCEQTLDPWRYEICIVDNACTDATPDIVAAVAARYPRHNLFIVSEPVAGLSRARNCGIAATHAPLIADIDDDATANRDWLECFVLRFAELSDTVGIIGGDVLPVWGTEPPEWLNPLMKGILSAALNLGDAARFLQPHEGLLECNTCYRRTALAAAGNFPVELGRVNNMLLSGEGAVNALIRAKGWSLFFEPRAVVRHMISADRMTPSWLRKRVFWQGISDYAMFGYYRRSGLQTVSQINLDLPLSPDDWAFVKRDTADNLDGTMRKLQSLGFVLAMSGIIPTGEN